MFLHQLHNSLVEKPGKLTCIGGYNIMPATARSIFRCPFDRAPERLSMSRNFRCLLSRQTRSTTHHFATSARLGNTNGSAQNKGPFRSRLRTALRNTKVDWAPIPVGLGVAFLGAVQFYRVRERERKRREEDYLESDSDGESKVEDRSRPKKRKRIRPSGPWYGNIGHQKQDHGRC